MITWVGLCAGEVWNYLDLHGSECPLETLITDIDAPRETILMAIGWLGREGYIMLNGNLPNPTLRLNTQFRTRSKK